MTSDADFPTLEKEDIQSPILRRRPAPYIGCHVLLHFAERAQARAFVGRLRPHITSAADYASVDTWAAIAFTYTGLQALGVPRTSLDTFPRAFREGMAARAASFEESEDNLPKHWEEPYGTGRIHAALTLLSVSESTFQDKVALARQQLHGLPGVQVLKREDFAQVPGGRTPFGYKDGISFPTIKGNDASPILSSEPAIAAGEFVLGYPGDSGRSIPVPQPDILGRNGTFAGLRKLHSHVATFRRFLRDNATAPLTSDSLAAKMIGRWPSGAPLMLAPDEDRPEFGADLQQMNNFLYREDPRGLRCPLGAHIRRMNPRDTQLTVLDNVNLHRIIRHGNAYGPPLPEGVCEDDGERRGIFFIFLSATAPETYEFLKKHWIEDGNFLGLDAQRDPIAGSHDGNGMFTVPMRPVRRRIHMLESFTRTLGGEYGFMPSLGALRWLSELSDG
jgi:deferrochelatase/peroxidase EfeB